MDFVDAQIKEKERTFDASITRDYIDAFISKIREQDGTSETTFTCKCTIFALFKCRRPRLSIQLWLAH